jgi:hypothetical protein
MPAQEMSPWEAAYRAYVAAAKAYWNALDVDAIDFRAPHNLLFPIPEGETCHPGCCYPSHQRCTPCQITNVNVVLCLPCISSMGTLGTLGMGGGGGGPTAPPPSRQT